MLPEDALIYLKALATALEVVHSYGYVHSTVSPAHIQATRDGSVMLANYGFARQIDRPMMRTGVYDLPLCQAPEQLRGERFIPQRISTPSDPGFRIPDRSTPFPEDTKWISGVRSGGSSGARQCSYQSGAAGCSQL